MGGPALTLVLDMEGLRNPGPQAVAHATAWVQAVSEAWYRPMIYLGYDSGLTSHDCDQLPCDPIFWCDAGPYNMRPAPTKHFALKQWPQAMISGVPIDRNDVLQDGAVVGLASAPLRVAA